MTNTPNYTQPFDQPVTADRVHPYEIDWGKEYTKCPFFSKNWETMQTPQADWPEGVRIFGNKMYKEERLCVLLQLQDSIVRENHFEMAHVGGERL